MQKYTPSSLFAGEYPIVTQSIKIAQGQQLSKGALLGRIETSNQYVLSNATAKDGSKLPSVVLAEDVDALQGEINAVCYLSGQFNTNALTFGDGHTPQSVTNHLRQLNIYLTNTI